MLPGKKGQAYGPFNALEAEITKEEASFLDCLHGRDLTNTSIDSKEDSLIEKYLNFIYDFSATPPKCRFRQVVNTDLSESNDHLGPYDRVFHIIY